MGYTDGWISITSSLHFVRYLLQKKYFMLDSSMPVSIIFRNEDLGTVNKGEIIIQRYRESKDKDSLT